MYVIFIILECPYIYKIAKHAFPKLYLNIKMSVFDAKKESILAGFLKLTRQGICKLNNAASNVQQDK